MHAHESEGRVDLTVHAVIARTLATCSLPALLLIVLGLWPLGLIFAAVCAANLWFVDHGARQLIDAALDRNPRR